MRYMLSLWFQDREIITRMDKCGFSSRTECNGIDYSFLLLLKLVTLKPCWRKQELLLCLFYSFLLLLFYTEMFKVTKINTLSVSLHATDC